MVLERNNILARGMRIDDALMFMQAYCEKYFMEVCELTLREEPRDWELREGDPDDRA